MSKRLPGSQEPKTPGILTGTFNEKDQPPVKASAATMSGRKVLSTKARRTAPNSNFNPGSSLQAFANPFASPTQTSFGSPTQNPFGSQNQNPFGSQTQNPFGSSTQNTANSAEGVPNSNTNMNPQQSGFGFGSPQPFGNSFGSPSQNTVSSADGAPNPNTNIFNQQQSSFAFGSPQAFGNTFGAPTQKNTANSADGAPISNTNNSTPQQNGFAFGSPQPQNIQPQSNQPQNSQPFGLSQTQNQNNSPFGSPAPQNSAFGGFTKSTPFGFGASSSFGGFGQQTGVAQEQPQSAPQNDSDGGMEISPQATPSKGSATQPNPSIFGALAGGGSSIPGLGTVPQQPSIHTVSTPASGIPISKYFTIPGDSTPALFAPGYEPTTKLFNEVPDPAIQGNFHDSYEVLGETSSTKPGDAEVKKTAIPPKKPATQPKKAAPVVLVPTKKKPVPNPNYVRRGPIGPPIDGHAQPLRPVGPKSLPPPHKEAPFTPHQEAPSAQPQETPAAPHEEEASAPPGEAPCVPPQEAPSAPPQEEASAPRVEAVFPQSGHRARGYNKHETNIQYCLWRSPTPQSEPTPDYWDGVLRDSDDDMPETLPDFHDEEMNQLESQLSALSLQVDCEMTDTNPTCDQAPVSFPPQPPSNPFGFNPSTFTPSAQNLFSAFGAPAPSNPPQMGSNSLSDHASMNKPTTFSDEQKRDYLSKLALMRLNEGFRKVLATMDSCTDWSEYMYAYVSQVQRISAAGTVPTGGSPAANATMTRHKRNAGDDASNEGFKKSRSDTGPSESLSHTTENGTGQSQTANLFQNILGKKDLVQPSTPTKAANTFQTPSTTPAGQPSTNVFTSKPQPPSSSNIFGSAKPAQSNTPSANLFTPPTPAGQPSTNMFTSKPQPSPNSNIFGSAKPAPSNTPSGNLFTPKISSQGNASSVFSPQPAKETSQNLNTAAPNVTGNTASTGVFGSAMKTSNGDPLTQPPSLYPSLSNAKPLIDDSTQGSKSSTTPSAFSFKPLPATTTGKTTSSAPSFAKPSSNDSIQNSKPSTTASPFSFKPLPATTSAKTTSSAPSFAKSSSNDSTQDSKSSTTPSPFSFKPPPGTTTAKTTSSASSFAAPIAKANFMSQFGARASVDADKLAAEAKAKQRADEFDSEEDDEEEWERNYAEEQAKKKEQAAMQTSKAPVFATVGGNFMSAFSKSAEQSQAEQKAKRKAEEFDSEEDDEEEWERNYAEEQRQKKAKLSESAATGRGFFVPGKDFEAAVSTEKALPSQSTTSETFKPQLKAVFGTGESVFAGGQRPHPDATASDNIFGHLSSKSSQNTSGTEKAVPSQPTTNETFKSQPKAVFGTGQSVFSGAKRTHTEAMASGNISSHTPHVSALSYSDEEDGEENDGADADVDEQIRPHKRGRSSRSNSPVEDTETLEETMARIRKGAKSSAQPAQVNTNQVNATPGKSLFDRISPADKGNVPSKKAGDGSQAHPFGVDGTSDDYDAGNSPRVSNSVGSDHTWKADSPIKFGAATPAFNFTPATPSKSTATNGTETTTPAGRPFAGLFSSAKADNSSSLFGGQRSSEVGFGFGAPSKTDGSSVPSFLFPPAASVAGSAISSEATSRATSPGVPDSTNGDSEDSAAPDVQNDFAALTAAELREEEVLFEIQKARCSMFNKDADKQWELKGTGPLRVLRNKTTRATRVLHRITGTGKIVINSRVQKSYNYTHMGKGQTRFVIVGASGKPETYVVKMASDENAKKFADVCESSKEG